MSFPIPAIKPDLELNRVAELVGDRTHYIYPDLEFEQGVEGPFKNLLYSGE